MPSNYDDDDMLPWDLQSVDLEPTDEDLQRIADEEALVEFMDQERRLEELIERYG